MSFLSYTGSNFFRQRIILSTLSGKPIVIRNIRDSDDDPGINDYEDSFLRLIDSITDGSNTVVNETGTVVKYAPGLLVGGRVKHDCHLSRSIGYYLEALLCLAPFCKKPLEITLTGITNDNIDSSVDAVKHCSLHLLKRFIIKDENLELNIISRGLAPGGGGEILFKCPIVNYIRPTQLLDPGKIKRIRGVAYSVRVSPAMASRMVDVAKGILLTFLPDIYIYTDHYKGKHSGKSPGFGITLFAESTTGAFYSADVVSKPSGTKSNFIAPEDIAKQAVYELLEEINRGGCASSREQSLACLFMALSTTDVSKVKTGPLSPYTIEFLRHIEDFFQIRMKLETEKSETLRLGTHKVLITCTGSGYTNLSRKVI